MPPTRLMLRKFIIRQRSDHYILEVLSKWREDHAWRTTVSMRLHETDLERLREAINEKI